MSQYSSPLFNVYHRAVLENFRIRKQIKASQLGASPGLGWICKVDGRIDHDVHSRRHLTGNSAQVCLGDIGFADDATLMGEAEEMVHAERILEETMNDWREKIHPGKTEGLRLQVPYRRPHDIRGKGEAAAARHVGGILRERGSRNPDLQVKRTQAYFKIGQTARAWLLGAQKSRIPQHPSGQNHESSDHANPHLFWKNSGLDTRPDTANARSFGLGSAALPSDSSPLEASAPCQCQ